MKSNKVLLKHFLTFFIVIIFSFSAQAQIETVGCFDSNGNLIPKYQSWDEVYNGVKYRCTCNGDGTTDCVQESSSSSSSNNSGGTDLNGQIMQSLVEPLIQNFFDWLFAPSSSSQDNQQEGLTAGDQERIKAESEENERKAAEYRSKMKEQIEKLNNEYSQLMKDKFEDQKQSTVNEFKNKVAKSDAIKNIKLLNCAAFQSLEALKMISQDNGDFSDLNGPLENSTQLADFTSSKTSNCPEIIIKVPEVTVSNPRGFQQLFFETVKHKTDSMTVSVVLLKEKSKQIKSDIVEKEKVVEQLKTIKPSDKGKDDQLLNDALIALNEALQEEKKVTEELTKSEKDIEVFEKVRGVYDVKKPL